MFRVCRRPTAGPERVPAVDATGIRYSNTGGVGDPDPRSPRAESSAQSSRVRSHGTALARRSPPWGETKADFLLFFGLLLQTLVFPTCVCVLQQLSGSSTSRTPTATRARARCGLRGVATGVPSLFVSRRGSVGRTSHGSGTLRSLRGGPSKRTGPPRSLPHCRCALCSCATSCCIPHERSEAKGKRTA